MQRQLKHGSFLHGDSRLLQKTEIRQLQNSVLAALWFRSPYRLPRELREREISLKWVKQKVRKYLFEEMIYELSPGEVGVGDWESVPDRGNSGC